MSNAYGRYVRKDRRIYNHSTCLYCGSAYGVCVGSVMACGTTTCLACGTKQCSSNGLARGQCAVCYVGLLPRWSGSTCQCSYKGCTAQAVARVDGQNKNRCALHLERGKWQGYVAKRLAERDQHWELLGDAQLPILGQRRTQ